MEFSPVTPDSEIARSTRWRGNLDSQLTPHLIESIGDDHLGPGVHEGSSLTLTAKTLIELGEFRPFSPRLDPGNDRLIKLVPVDMKPIAGRATDRHQDGS
tara:strand:+ start:13220 stop:13519 length:300 start_codon:yes stop_codon:yes gene_type:complete